MTLTYLVEATDGGAALPRLARAIAATARPGDHVVLVDRGSADDTPAQLAALRWPAGVTARICAETPVSETDWTLQLTATSQLFPAALITARHLAKAPLRAVIGPPGSPALLRLTRWPATWAALSAATTGADVMQAPRAFATAPPAALTQDDLTALAALPDRDWAQAQITARTRDTGPGPRAVLDPGPFALAAPAVHRGAPLTLCLQGDHAHRMPLAWPHLKPLWSDHARLTDDPTAADLILWAHPRDLTGASPAAARARAPHVLMSEEPFWDTLFSPDPLADRITLPASHAGLIRLHQRNHHTSPIFAWDHLPYYLLTQKGFVPAYQSLFRRNAALSAADWKASFANRRTDSAFMAERRPEAFHDLRHDAGDITGLCAWRTRLALAAPGQVRRIGASWGSQRQTRFQLADWHADKLAQMDMGPRMLSGVENTHQPAYLSEKLFDAFACGTRPLYVASPRHSVTRLGLPDAAWVNLWDMDSTAAAAHLGALPWDRGFDQAYAAAQQALATRLHDDTALEAERTRLGTAILSDLRRSADLGPA